MNQDDRSTERTTEILGDAATWAPEPDVLDDILADIRSEPTPTHRAIWAVAAAAVVAIAVVGFASTRPDPVDFVLVGTELAPTAAADVRLVETPGGLIYRLDVSGLDAAVDGTYYEGWVESDSGSVSVGTFHMRGGDGAIAFWSGVDPDRYPTLVVTLEQEGDGPARSDAVVLAGQA